MREVVMKQLLDVKNSLLGVEGGQDSGLHGMFLCISPQ